MTTCACPTCKCELDTNAIQRDGQGYCCTACADRHPNGEMCKNAQCTCAEDSRTAESNHNQDTMDQALEETFPASDPISP